MIPGTFALNIYRGDDHAWRFLLWVDAEKTTPVDLTGMTVEAEVRDRPGGAVIVAALVTVTLPNTVDVVLDHDKTRTLPANGRWDLQVTDAGGQVSTFLAGPVKVTGDITDSDLATTARRTSGYLTEPAT